MKREVGIYEAKAQLSRLIAEVQESGKPITICKQGHPVVDLVPHSQARDPLKSDPTLRGARFLDDPTAGIDEVDWPPELR